MIEKTKNYDLFMFREDNREKIDNAHVQKLMDSINSRNLLQLRPIMVNEKMEIIDGQHRLLAAKNLGVEIYYQKEKKLDASDIIRVNISKPWTSADYLNYYCQHDYSEYKKLKEFMQKNSLSLKIALNIALGQSHAGFNEFRLGEFKFNSEVLDQELSVCWDTIHYIKKHNGFSTYTSSSRFWKALLKLVRHKDFEEMKWRSNFQKMISNFRPQARTSDYLQTMQYIYNWHTVNKIKLIDD